MKTTNEIVTLTPNPAVDYVLNVDRLEPGGFHRLASSQRFGSGKGINVSLALAALGRTSTAVYPAGGEAGAHVTAALRSAGVLAQPVHILRATRTNTKVVEADGRCTELNEPGPVLSEDEVAELGAALEHAVASAQTLVVSGSLPGGLDAESLGSILQQLRTARPELRIAVDTSGENLRSLVRRGGFLLKPNAEEAAALLGRPVGDLRQAQDAARRLAHEAGHAVLLSLGAAGAVYADADDVWSEAAPKIDRVISTVGCGDTLLAAWIYAGWRGDAPPQALHFAVRAASCKASLPYGTFPTRVALE